MPEDVFDPFPWEEVFIGGIYGGLLLLNTRRHVRRLR